MRSVSLSITGWAYCVSTQLPVMKTGPPPAGAAQSGGAATDGVTPTASVAASMVPAIASTAQFRRTDMRCLRPSSFAPPWRPRGTAVDSNAADGTSQDTTWEVLLRAGSETRAPDQEVRRAR